MRFDRSDPSPAVYRGLWLAGLYNVGGVLLFSQGLTSQSLPAQDPQVFSTLGLLAIMLWGCAYASVARVYQRVPGLLLIFALEKLLYTGNWLLWLDAHAQRLPALFAEAPLTAVFYGIYGAGDFAFAIFFALAGIRAWRDS